MVLSGQFSVHCLPNPNRLPLTIVCMIAGIPLESRHADAYPGAYARGQALQVFAMFQVVCQLLLLIAAYTYSPGNQTLPV